MINGGFLLWQEVCDYVNEREEFIEQPLARLTETRRSLTCRQTGFGQGLDTLNDKIAFDRMEARGGCPWAVCKVGT